MSTEKKNYVISVGAGWVPVESVSLRGAKTLAAKHFWCEPHMRISVGRDTDDGVEVLAYRQPGGCPQWIDVEWD